MVATRDAAIYCRISQDRAGAGVGVARQERECRALADRLGWTVAVVRIDNDLSAYSGKPRPGYEALLQDLGAGRVNAVLAWHTDRLHRSTTELEEYITVCEPTSAPTMTVTAGPLDLATPSGRLVARQLGAVARYESEHKGERVRAARDQAAVEGRWHGGRRPYGYAPDGVTVEPAEAAIVAEATEALLAGASVRGLADQLNQRGVPSTTGGMWSGISLRRIVMRARNAGLRTHRGEVVGPAVWPAIVPEDSWRAVTAMLTNPNRYRNLPPARRWLGSGRYLCDVCSTRLHVSSGGRGRISTGYVCAGHVYRSAAHTDAYVTEVLIERLSRPDAAELLADPTIEVDVPGLRAESLALRQRLDELAELYSSGVVDLRQLRAGTDSARRRLEEIESTLARAAVTSPLTGLVGADDVASAWNALDLGRRRAVLTAVAEVRLLPVQKRGRQPGGRYFDPESVQVAFVR